MVSPVPTRVGVRSDPVGPAPGVPKRRTRRSASPRSSTLPGLGILVFVGVVALSPAPASRAEDATEPVAGLEEAVTLALRRNPGVKAAFQRWRAALAEVPQAKAFPDPKLTYAYYLENVETRVGPQEHAVAVQQTLPTAGKRRCRGRAAEANARALEKQYEQVKLDLLYDVKTVYYDLYYLGRAIQITRDNMKLLEALEKVAQSRYKTGGAMAPLVQLQTELGKLEDRVQELTALRPARAAQLNALLGRPAEASVPWPEAIVVPDAELEQRNVEAELAARSPLLERFDAQAKRHELQAALANKKRWPDVTVGLKTIATGDARAPGTPGSGTDAVLATVSVNFPIWRTKYAAEAEEAKRKREAARYDGADTLNRLRAQVKMAVFRYRDAGRKINLYRDTLVPKAEQSLKVARQAFEAGETAFLTLIDAERMLLEFELQHERARTERARQYALIEKLIASPLPLGTEEQDVTLEPAPEEEAE